MKIALVGYGKMGRLIEQLSPENDCEVVLRLDEHTNASGAGITKQNFAGVDVAIEFSTPGTVVDNIGRIAALGVNIVVGTTGWAAELAHVREMVTERGVGLVWSPNFSIGVNVFQRLVAEAAKLLEHQAQYESWAWEIHHSAKKDAPSGTLLKLVEEMRHAGWDREISVASNRAGAIPGTHEIGFDSSADTITHCGIRPATARGSRKARYGRRAGSRGNKAVTNSARSFSGNGGEPCLQDAARH